MAAQVKQDLDDTNVAFVDGNVQSRLTTLVSSIQISTRVCQQLHHAERHDISYSPNYMLQNIGDAKNLAICFGNQRATVQRIGYGITGANFPLHYTSIDLPWLVTEGSVVGCSVSIFVLNLQLSAPTEQQSNHLEQYIVL